MSAFTFPLIGARPRSESLYDTEAYAPAIWSLDGHVVERVLGLGPYPYQHYLVRRQHDRRRIVVEAAALKEIPMAPIMVFSGFSGFSGAPARPFRGFARAAGSRAGFCS